MTVGVSWKETDDFAAVYEPLSKDGAYIPFRPPAPEDMQEPMKLERLSIRYTPVAAPKIRRLVSVVRSREALRQRELDVQALPVADGKKADTSSFSVEDDYHEKGRVEPAGYAVEFKPDVDTEAEDSEAEVSTTELCIVARPTFRDSIHQAPDGCNHLIVPPKGPLYSHDEPPDFLQLPEPIKQRTAGAARVAAAARAWAAASAHNLHPNGRQEGPLPATARGGPSPNHAAAIVEELNFRHAGGHYGQASAPPASPQAHRDSRGGHMENPQAVAGPAVLALRRMRNQMSALAEGRLPWNFSSRDRRAQQGEDRPTEHVPQPPQQPHSGQRRPLLPNLGNAVAAARGSSAAVQAQAGPAGSAADGQPGADNGEQMQSLVPAPPSQPKPSNGNSRFWRRPWPRMNIMNSLGFGSSSGSGASSSRDPVSMAASSGGASSAQASGEQSRPGTQATASARHRNGASEASPIQQMSADLPH